jgi:F-type H+-transporting ATPase subunit b
MSRVALPRIEGIIADREGRLSGDLAAAGKLKDETDAAIAAYEKALSDAKAKAQSIAGETRAKLAAESEAKRKAVEAELAGKLRSAEELIGQNREQAMANVRGIAVDAASAIVERLIGKAPARAAVEAAVADAVRK